MKKVLIFCLILLCTLSVFAADVAAKVKVYLSYGSDGFGFSSNKGTWEPVLTLSANGNAAGYEFKWCPIINNNSSTFSFNIWVKPFGIKNHFFYNEKLEYTKLQVGSYISADSSFMAYGVVDFTSQAFSYKESSANKDNTIYSGFGFGYKPNSINDFTNADLFIAGYFNNVNKNFGTIHYDGVLKLNIEDNKPSLNHSLSELTFNRFKDEKYNYNSSTDSIVAIDDKFGFDEDYFFDHESRTREHDSWNVYAFSTGFVAGLRYKYFTDADKTVYNGLYGYGLGSYQLLDDNNNKPTVSFEAEAEIGLNNAELEIESRGSINKTPEKFYSQYKFDWTDGKLDASITDVSLYLKHDLEGCAIYIQTNYKNLGTNSAKDNGFFFNPGVTFNVGSCGLDIGAAVGFDSQKNFKWSAQSQSAFTVAF